MTSLSGIAAIVGKLVTGWLLDHLSPNWVGGLTLAAAALAFLLLVQGIRSPALIVVAMLVNGYAAGTKTVAEGIASRKIAEPYQGSGREDRFRLEVQGKLLDRKALPKVKGTWLKLSWADVVS